MPNYQFENPEFLWGLLLLIPLIIWQWWQRRQSHSEVIYPGTDTLAGLRGNWLAQLRPVLAILRYLAITLAIVAMARPRTSEQNTKSQDTEGIDIMITVDVSTSMQAQDFKPNRIEATKEVANAFIEGRPNDRIGLVVYAGEAYTQTPLTSDHKVLKQSLAEVKRLIEDGTAIGMGLATSVNRLKDSKAKSKVIILLTDGENNRGEIAPLTAAQLAEEFNIRVYTIGVGSKGRARTPVGRDFFGKLQYAMVPVNIDEALLKQIADRTGGRYFRATDNQKLQEIYREIDDLEKTKLQELKFYTYDEKFDLFVLWALGLFVLEMTLRYTLFKSIV